MSERKPYYSIYDWPEDEQLLPKSDPPIVDHLFKLAKLGSGVIVLCYAMLFSILGSQT